MARKRAASQGQVDGVVTAVVAANRDPKGLGRVKVAFADTDREVWARVATPLAGDGRGVHFFPEVGDEVLVAFEGGDPRSPYVLGALWGGSSDPPERIEIADGKGGSSITIDSASGAITIAAEGDVTIRSAGGTLRLEGVRVEIDAAAVLEARGAQVEIAGDAVASIKGGIVTIN
ncbi:MAG: phage baseplate assembly protein V [Gaiellaceae bacterium]